jgi:hypothetical protein
VFVESGTLDEDKRVLSDFYEEYGWHRPEPGAFYNAQSRYGFDSATLLKHRRLVNLEQKRHFHPNGNLFLDCGPARSLRRSTSSTHVDSSFTFA